MERPFVFGTFGKVVDKLVLGTSPLEIEEKVSSLINREGKWDVDKFNQFLPHNVVIAVKSITFPNILDLEDEPIWGPSLDGLFSTKSTFQALNFDTSSRNNPLFSCIWRWEGPKRFKIFGGKPQIRC